MVKNKKQFKKNLIKKRILWFLIGIIFLEFILRFSGFVYIEIQDYKNKNPKEDINEADGAYRILCLGDSTTADLFNGQGSWPEELEKILNNRSPEIRFKVFNEGVPAINSIYISNNLEGNLRKYAPDMVIAMMGVNDVPIRGEITKKNKFTSFFMKLKVVKLFNLIYSHWDGKLDKIKRDIYRAFKKSDAVPKNDISYYNLLNRLWNIENTEDVLKKAIELDPEDYEAYVELGAFYHAQNKLENAEDVLKKAAELDRGNEMAYGGLGMVYQEQRKFKNAEEMFEKAIELNPDNEWAYVELGWAYYSQGKFKEAEEIFKKAIELNPDNDWAYIGLGRAYRNQGKFKEVEEIFKKAIELNPDNTLLYMELGWAYYSQGKFKEAEDTFKQGIKLNPYNEEADFGVEGLYLWLGFLYDIQGKFKEAEDLYNKLSKIKEINPILSKNYQRMYKILNEEGIKFVAMQYPTKNVDELKSMFDKFQQKNTIFISNEENFKSALNNASFTDYFTDLFRGSFGHCTLRGNRLIAENVADAIMDGLVIS